MVRYIFKDRFSFFDIVGLAVMVSIRPEVGLAVFLVLCGLLGAASWRLNRRFGQ